MCGLAGLARTDRKAPEAAVLDAMLGALRHRGPDGVGRHVAGDVGLVHARLAIIDLTSGDQPLRDQGGAALVANAEIYNYVELRQQMPGVAFATKSDCEPALPLYRRDGAAFAASLRGMYAVALHDAGGGELVLSRDPFGIKPLYYAETAQGLAFASEPRAFFAAGLLTPIVAPRARNELLQLQFTTGRDTIYDGVRRLLPGETLVVRQGRIVDRRRIEALPLGPPRATSEDEALQQLEAALMDSVGVHQRADVPYGLFFSGGIDSSVLLALMARLNTRPVRTYTVGFASPHVADEREQAAVLAKQMGALHVAVEFTEDDFWNLAPRVVAAMDDPAADYAILPSWKLSQVAARGVKVVLTGEGGDEIFGGYGRYRSAVRPWWLGGRAMRAKGVLDGLGLLRERPTGWRDGILAAEGAVATPGRTRLQRAQAADCVDWLPHDLLLKVDRCLMAHGLEGRTPYLDPVVADMGFRLPDDLKVRGGKGKYLLRQWLARNFPAAQPFAPKRGFTVPVGDWILARGARLAPLVAQQPGVAEVCDPVAVRRLYGGNGKRVAFAAWTLLFYALWHSIHVLGRRADGDVWAMLDRG
jgi:asparagine synthase (glutamine-hydrolysing)